MKTNLIGLVLVATGAANAAIMIDLGNNPQSDELEVLFSKGVTGTSVTSTFNNTAVANPMFISTQTLESDASGQAKISAFGKNVPLDNITISLSGGATFDDIIFALNATNGSGPNPTYDITANGTLTTKSITGTVTTGNQFFTIVGNGEKLTSINITSSGLDDIRRVRFSGVTAPGGGGGGGGEIPEPSTFAMFGGGLAMYVLTRKFRTQR